MKWNDKKKRVESKSEISIIMNMNVVSQGFVSIPHYICHTNVCRVTSTKCLNSAIIRW